MKYKVSDYISKEELRNQCRVWHDKDDALLEMYCEAALELVSAEINRDIYPAEGGEMPKETSCYWPIRFNARLRAATLLVTCDLYENREMQLSYNIFENRTMKLLIDPMRFLQVRSQ